MKKLLLATLFFIALSLLTGCFSHEYKFSAYGDNAILKFQNGSKLECEIIFFTDSTIIFSQLPEHHFNYSLRPNNLYYVKINKIKSITIKGYDGGNWPISVLLLQAIPSCLFTIAAATAEVRVMPAILIGGIPTLITSLCFLGTEGEAPKWNKGDSQIQISDLKLHTRYPNGLSNVELTKLLEKSGQKELKKYVVNQ